MDKSFIISEIKRTASVNGGQPLGSQRFERETGIRRKDWFGKYWRSWGDAVVEAGLAPIDFQTAFDESYILDQFIQLIREIQRFPVEADLRIKARNDRNFPSHGCFARLGNRSERIRRVVRYCQEHPDLDEVRRLCPTIPDEDPTIPEAKSRTVDSFGFVYLLRSGRHYKIGKSNAVGRRERELAIQLPQKAERVHVISTDDPAGIEAYWHNRFAEKRTNGEWFELTTEDVGAFRRRKFM